MNRRSFLLAAAAALVLPYEPKRVYSFARPGLEKMTLAEFHAYLEEEMSIAVLGQQR